MKFILPIKAVINAQKCIANRDVRFYLEGFHVTKQTVEATNGHYLYQATMKQFEYPSYICEMDIDNQLPESMIIKMKQPIKQPAKRLGCEFVIFDVEDSKVIATTVDQYGLDVGVFLGEVVEGRFPDCEKVIPKGEVECHSQVGFNANYLKKLSEITGYTGHVKMQSYGEQKAAVFTVLDHVNMHFDAVFVVMPIRL